MPVNKLQRFAEIASLDNVLEYTDFQGEKEKPKGTWSSHIFQDTNPITLELGCGKGAYTLELARRYPGRNFVGIDIKGARIWKGAKRAKAEGLTNIRFLRMYIDHLDEYFAPREVHELWITFPDPYSQAGDRSKRLTSPRFLKLYQHVLQKKGVIHFKTDDGDFFDYTLRTVRKEGAVILEQINDIYGQQETDGLLAIQTDFEKKHLQKGKTISYCKFTLP